MENNLKFELVTTRSGVQRQRVTFGGELKGGVKDMRLALKASGLSNNQARNRINELLTNGEGNLRYAQAAVALECARKDNFFPVEFSKTEKTACLRLAKIPEITIKSKVTQESYESKLAALRRKAIEYGIGEADLKDMGL